MAENLVQKNKELESTNARLEKERNRLNDLYDEESDAARSAENEVTRLKAAQQSLEKNLRELERKLTSTDTQGGNLAELREKLENEHSVLKRDLQDVTYRLQKAEQEVAVRDAQLTKLRTEFAGQQEANIKLKAEKATAQSNADVGYQLESEIKKLNRSNKELLEVLNQTNSKVSDASREINTLNTACLSLESKITALTRQKEEADASAASHLAKVSKAHADLKEANARADAAETLASEIRAQRRHH